MLSIVGFEIDFLLLLEPATFHLGTQSSEHFLGSQKRYIPRHTRTFHLQSSLLSGPITQHDVFWQISGNCLICANRFARGHIKSGMCVCASARAVAAALVALKHKSLEVRGIGSQGCLLSRLHHCSGAKAMHRNTYSRRDSPRSPVRRSAQNAMHVGHNDIAMCTFYYTAAAAGGGACMCTLQNGSMQSSRS